MCYFQLNLHSVDDRRTEMTSSYMKHRRLEQHDIMSIKADISHFFAMMKYVLDNIYDRKNFEDEFLS